MTWRNVTAGKLALGVALAVAAALGIGATRTGAADTTAYLTAPVERGDLITTVAATGALNAGVTVRVGSQLSGQIRELLADFNHEVTKGQPIAELDPQTFAARVREAEAALEVAAADVRIREAAIKQAEAGLADAYGGLAAAAARIESAQATAADARRTMERTQMLRKGGTLPESEVDRTVAAYESSSALVRAAEAERRVREAAVLAAEAGIEIAEAELENARATVRQRDAGLDQAELDLERTVIRAPIDGVVVGRDVDRGQTVAASLEAPTLFTIAGDLHEMEVHARVDEADIGRIEPGQRAAFTVDAYLERTFAGTVVEVRKAPEVIQNVVTYTVVISAENPDLLLLPGMTALVQIVVEEVEDVLKVPNAALRFQPPESATAALAEDAATGHGVGAGMPAVVWVPGGGGRPAPVPIGIGASDAAATAVIAGPLEAGDEVIVGAAVAGDEGASFFGIRLGL